MEIVTDKKDRWDIKLTDFVYLKVSGIIYKSKGEVERRNDNRYRTTAVNATYIVSI